jgi:predicted XRE-type DNA-binding protein
MKESDLTQKETAEIMGVQRSRIGDICRGKTVGFTLDSLVAMTARAGLHPLLIAA